MRDLHNHLKFVPVTAPVSGAGDDVAQTGTAVDRLGYESLELVIQTGTLVDADATFTLVVEESDASGSGFAAVADADLIGTEASASFAFGDDGEIRKIGYKGNKRYVRTVITPATNTGAWPVAVLAVLGNARRSPSQDGAGAAVVQVP